MRNKLPKELKGEWPVEPLELNFPSPEDGVIIKNMAGKKRLVFPKLFLEMNQNRKYGGIAWKYVKYSNDSKPKK